MTKRNTHIERMRLAFIAMLLSIAWPSVVSAQDLEPRRWAHFPVGMNVASVTYVYTDGDLSFDPVLELDDVEMDAHTTVFAYARSLNVFGKTGRIDLILPYKDTSWEGILSGNPASTSRDGFADPWIRFSVNLLGAPALKGKEYLDYRAAHTTNTVLGAAIGVMLPLGEYKEDKLLNLGQNRFIIRPRLASFTLAGGGPTR